MYTVYDNRSTSEGDTRDNFLYLSLQGTNKYLMNQRWAREQSSMRAEVGAGAIEN
jgi:hypothetical protein